MYMFEERINNILQELKSEITSKSYPVGNYKYKKTTDIGYETYTYEQLDWPVLENGFWSSNREHYWFVTEVTIPAELDGKCVAYEIETGCGNGGDATKPQFEVYVNGKFVQGLDINHRSIVLSEQAKAGDTYRISLRAFGDKNPHILLQTQISFFGSQYYESLL